MGADDWGVATAAEDPDSDGEGAGGGPSPTPATAAVSASGDGAASTSDASQGPSAGGAGSDATQAAAAKPKESTAPWQVEMNTVYQGGVDEGREAMDADKIHAKKDYGHLYSHFDYETMGKWLQQTCRKSVSEASGAFVARAVERLLRDTIDDVLEIARVRQNQPETKVFEGAQLEVVESGVNIREKLAEMAKSRAALAKESTAEFAAVTSAAGNQEEKWGALADQNKAVASSIAMIDRKRKQVRPTIAAQSNFHISWCSYE